MSQAKALIVPSVCYETFGLVNIEAFSQSLPVIASKIGAMNLIVKDNFNGFHFVPGDYKSLQTVLDKFKSLNEEHLMSIKKNAYNTYLSKYTPEANLKQIDEIYTSLIERNDK